MGAIEIINKELAAASKSIDTEKYNAGILCGRTANETIKEALLTPDPNPLWLSLWYEGEVCCLFSDSNLGKSLYAVQIGIDIASRGMLVLYCDFELSDKQFQLRYSENKQPYIFPEGFIRVTIDRNKIVSEDAIIDSIESLAIKSGAKVVIIDNISWICMQSEKADAASTLMQRLTDLKFRHGLSLLVIAHTPKRSLSNPITQNDLAGSKRIYNFLDSCFAIGKSAKDDALRYIKQIKVRYGNYTYDGDNVITCEIVKEGRLTQFHAVGNCTEREHLREVTDKDNDKLIEKVKELRSRGKSLREIATELNISKSKVDRMSKAN